MSRMPRYAARRDENEPELVGLARTLGWFMVALHEPADWLGLRRGQWHVIEVKNPGCEGHADEYTPKQRRFHAEVFARGGTILTWREKTDVYRDSNARVSA